MDQARLRRPATRRDFEIAVICALPFEADPVDALFDHHWDYDGPPYDKAAGDSNAYSTGAVGRHNVVVAYMPGMGKANAAAVAANCRMSFPNIRLAVLVGVCGTVPFSPDDGEIVLGDVIVSDGVVQYDFGRRLPERFDRKDTLLDSLGRPNTEIRSLLAKLKSLHGRKTLRDKMASYMDMLRKVPELAAEYPGAAQDSLFQASYHHVGEGMLCEECGCNGLLVPRNRLKQDIPQPTVHFGLIASGDTVMKTGEDRDAIARQEGIVGFEMEGAGVWDSFPCVVIKGACNYADGHKAKSWQRYAAATAAACMKAFLDYWVPSLPWQTEQPSGPLLHSLSEPAQSSEGRSKSPASQAVHPWDSTHVVKKSPTNLPDPYDGIDESILKRIENQDEESLERAIQVLSWLSFVLDSLTVKALQHALCVAPGDKELHGDAQPSAKNLVSVCADLVVIDTKTERIGLVHETAKAYLKRIRSFRFPLAHAAIASACLAYLSLAEFSEFCSSETGLGSRLKRYPFYRYAAKYWSQHVLLGDLESSFQDSIVAFLESPQRYSADVIMARQGPSAWGADNPVPWTDWNRLSIQRKDSPLHAAATYGLRKTLDFLLKNKGYKVDQRNNFGETALHRAAQVGQTAIIDELLARGADLNAKVRQNYLGEATPIILASLCRQTDAVRVLLNRGADVNACDREKRIASLHLAAGMDTELTRFLLHYGAEPNFQAFRPPQFPEVGPMTSLHFCVYYAHEFEGGFDRAKLLLDNRANVDAQTGLGHTALHLAILGGYRELMRLLLEEGANISIKNRQGKSAARLAKELGHLPWISDLVPRHILDGGKFSPLHQAIWAKDHQLARQLLKQGVDVTEKDEDGNTAWDYCIMNADVELAEILADYLDANDTLKHTGSAAFDNAITRMTAFDYTDNRTWKSTLQIARHLLRFRKACNPDLDFARARSPICNYQKTYLICAAEGGRTSQVDFFLECGADVNAQDVFGNTAAHYAVANKHREIIMLLVRKGANLRLRNRGFGTPLSDAEGNGTRADLEAMLNELRLAKEGVNTNSKKDDEQAPLS